MKTIKIGDTVVRKSYGGDILFKVVDIKNQGNEELMELKGVYYRLQADALADDLLVKLK